MPDMPKIESGSNNEGLLPVPATQAQLETPTGSGWGRTISVPDSQESLLIGLPIEIQEHIISFLKFRDVACLQQVCTHFRQTIEDNHELAKAWYRQFTSPLQYRLKWALPTKDVKQLTKWLQLFTKDKQLITSLMEHQEKDYFPALFYFTQARLMSECEKFEVDTKAAIVHGHRIKSVSTVLNGLYIAVAGTHMARIYARQFNELQSEFRWVEKTKIFHNFVKDVRFSNDARCLVTISLDYTGKICRQKDDGSWQEEFTISHASKINSAAISPNNQYLVTACLDGTAKILTLKDDGLWEEKDLISLDRPIESAEFSYDSQRLILACYDNTAKIYRLKNGLWEPEVNITHDNPVLLAFFSDDNRHVVTIDKEQKLKLHGLADNGLWQEKELAFNDSRVKSVLFSLDCHRLLITRRDCTVTIYGEEEDGSWKHEITISHDDPIISAALSLDERCVLTVSEDGTVMFHSLKLGSWHKTAVISDGKEVVTAMFSPADSRHVLICEDKTLKIYGQQTDGTWEPKAIISHDTPIWFTTFSYDGHYVTVICRDNTMFIYELRGHNRLIADTEGQK
ncbi:F-box/WD repeat-containing protein [Endozoicomonas sp. 4G]|uniref:F-box/WD repeat-containing protein n=1 Tax=Endozoicomonas sp. 4G TaxID=2872754 RepID=UPI00207892D0|nr:F-box/WD repeat-containing protein [Endozoicomonas sp. 4G]